MELYSVLRDKIEEKVKFFVCINRREVFDYLEKVDIILFVDEDETIGTYNLSLLMYGNYFEQKWSRKVVSYADLFYRVKNEIIDQFILELKEQGVHFLTLGVVENDEGTLKKFNDKILKNYQKYGIRDPRELPQTTVGLLPGEMKKEFLGELYTEEYVQQLNDKTVSATAFNLICEIKDVEYPLFNVRGGRRVTVNQPMEYEHCIYIYGPCIVIGVNVEDKHTIASFLQNKLNILGYKYRVENMGAFTGSRLMTINKIATTPLKKGDIVLWYSSTRSNPDINITDIVEENCLPVNWFMEQLAHCNHNVNKYVADEIYKKLLPVFQQPKQEWQGKCEVSGIVEWYLQMYFSKFDVSRYEKIGSIVMNCNPFTKGHRYLIEQALNRVDFLIIFVVEEDQSLFSFQERFAMVSYGVSDLENVMVVPSDEIILSRITFPEYFVKERDEDIIQNIENDITIFAERIAPALNITYRFVGEEPKDIVTGEYNKAMKRILPSYGIDVIEIPRLEKDGEVISASRVRANMGKVGDEQEKLLPDSTKQILYLKNE